MFERVQKVSIVMCTYNGEKYVREQLDSIIIQSYPIYELIIQDDCSTDNTFSILLEYANIHPFIRLYKNKKQIGINENFYSAMERVSGDYVAISDQDDIWAIDKIESQIRAIGDNWVCGGHSEPFSTKGVLSFDTRIPNIKIERLVHIGSAIPGHTMLLKKEFVLQALEYRSFPIILYDYLFLMLAGSFNKISFVDKVLVKYREHEASATFTVPVMKREGNHKSIDNIAQSFFRTLFLYFELKAKMRVYFSQIFTLLDSFPKEGSVNTDAKKIALYQSQKGLIAYIKLTCLYINLRKSIFHVEESNSFLSFLRAIYFPISCSDYYRYMSKSYKRNRV